jgi:hydroxyethylthiazole kinase-like uncharacterized protein yjeF
MKPIHKAEQVRAAERAAGQELASGRLMAKAAAGLAREVQSELADLGLRLRGARILLIVGPGDNGGDGLYAAAHLARRGARVRVWHPFDQVHSEGWAALMQAGGRADVVSAEAAIAAVAAVDLVIDAVFGIGARGGLPAELAQVAEACRRTGLPVVSADLPSGLAADEPQVVYESFSATRTVSFGAWKRCQMLEPARGRCGVRRLVDIGLELPDPDLRQMEVSDVARLWPRPDGASNKYNRGVVGFDTGSAAYPGAAVVGVLGAVYSGAGMVRYLGPARDLVLAAAPNVVCPLPPADDGPAWPGLIPAAGPIGPAALHDHRADAWVIGSGWGDRPGLRERLSEAMVEGVPVVVDAEAIHVLGQWVREHREDRQGSPVAATVSGRHHDRPEPGPWAEGRLPVPVLLTPHAGELARLLGWRRQTVEADPVTAVHAACWQTGATVLLKGATQYVASPGCEATDLCFPGPAWTAQAGSGDLLAGICGTLLAAGHTPCSAALLAGSIQALAAARHLGPYPPQDLARYLPEVIAALPALPGGRG